MSLAPKRVEFEPLYSDLERRLEAIYGFFGSLGSGAEIYQLVYDLCTARPKPFTELLFVRLADFLERTAATVVSGKDAAARPWVGEKRLRRQGLEALAFSVWREKVIVEIKIRRGNRLLFQILDAIRRDRNGDIVVSSAVAAAIRSFVECNRHSDLPFNLYIEDFEKPHLIETRQYYAREAAGVAAIQTVSGFMREATRRLMDEAERSRRFCDNSSIERVVKECETQYVDAHKKRIYAEFESMISNERFEGFRIPDRVAPLLEIYERFIASNGRAIVMKMGAGVAKVVFARFCLQFTPPLTPSSTQDPREYVDSLIQLQKRYMDVSNTVFSGNALYIAAVDKAHAPEVLARYCDLMLKRSTKVALSETEIEAKLGSLITIFKYIEDKDVFQKFYSRHLAKRLIFTTSISDESEASMISRLKEACGVEYTAKLQRMFTDMTLSNEINGKFQEFTERSGIQLGVDFGALVLTAGSWPMTGLTGSEFQLPQELEKSVEQFAMFYNANHNGRKLTWMWHLSKGDLRLNYLDKRYEVNASLYQVGTLLQFNTAESFTFQELRDATRLSVSELKRVLKSIVEVKIFTVSDQDVSEECVVYLNLDFSSKRTKLKLATSTERDTPAEVEHTRTAVDEDRLLYIQAAIVRIMKSRKELLHVELVSEVLRQAGARFIPSVPMIKKSIEHLIDKQYLERNNVNRDRYVYIA
ncbi:Cullin-2 [Gonapodya sp. JEL0774]|nr:Cullin-2 [Gonapodya sp. JEL0774]